MRKYLILLIALFINPVSVYSNFYTVEANDTLWSIAMKYDSDVYTLSKINDIVNNQIYLNQIIAIPESISNYTVQPGDNLIKIANRLNSEVQYIIIYNNLATEILSIGQTLMIPIIETAELPTSNNQSENINITNTEIISENTNNNKMTLIYEVASGDTLSSIAREHQITVDDILLCNNKSSETIYVGEELILKIGPTTPFDDNIDPGIETNLTINDITQEIKTLYEVSSGDTLSEIAELYGVSTESIKEWNNKSNENIFLGEKLILYIDKDYYLDNNTEFIYVVSKGDTLSQIALEYDVSVDDILSWNNKTCQTIFIGEILSLYIPDDFETLPTLNESQTEYLYSVSSGDTLSHIALKYNVSVSDIIEWNNKINDVVYLGETLTIYSDSEPLITTPPGTVELNYEVSSGDSLGYIALLYHLSTEDIKEWNRLDNNTIYVGDKLTLYVSPSVLSSGGSSSEVWEEINDLPIEKNVISGIQLTSRGVEIELNDDSQVVSMESGTVEYSGKMSGYNYVVIIKHDNNKRIVYGYLNETYVSKGDTITAGQSIGKVDYFSFYDKIKLYLEFRSGSQYIDVFQSLPVFSNIDYLLVSN